MSSALKRAGSNGNPGSTTSMMTSNTLPAELFDAPRFAEQVEQSAQTIPLYKHAIKAANHYLDELFRSGEDIDTIIALRATFFDQLLRCAWNAMDWPTDAAIGLIAVGGYGRGELLPYSDIDLLILMEDESLVDSCRTQIESFITFLWDINLDIGHSVRTLDECETEARNDITVATNLMECRSLAGPKTLLSAMQQRVGPDRIWPTPDFFRAKRNEQIARHRKYNNTEYNLEPNVKSCPGGLRDIQMIGWVVKRHFRAQNLRGLVSQGFLTEEEVSIICNGQSFLWKVRYALHMITQRAEDRLLFDLQGQVAEIMGYRDNQSKLAIEQFMQQYYRWALAVTELNDMLMQLFDEAILRACDPVEVFEINPRFSIRNGYIAAANKNVFRKDPSALLEIFVLMAQHKNIKGVRASTIRLIRESRHLIDDNFRADPHNKQLFLDFLRSPYSMALQLKRMKRYGVLGKYIPVFGDIIGLSQHDMFHIYTVDAHTTLLIKHLRRFGYPDATEKFPVAAHVFKRLQKRELVYIAGLFHDIGKGRGGNHSELGAVDAYDFCKSHGFNSRDCNLVEWLVKKHLLMSATAQRRDISDPDVIHDFALQMGDQVHLDYLFALTVADINATNPSLWNGWRASLLRQLYLETKRALRRGLEDPVDRQAWIEDTQQAAIAKLQSKGFTLEQIHAIWDNPGDEYFLRETSNDIAWQTEAIALHGDKRRPLIAIRDSSDRLTAGATQIFIHTKNRSYLFALIASTLEQLDLSVMDARIFSSASDYTLDTFFVLDADGEPIGDNPERISQIEHELREQLAAEEDYSEICKRRVPRRLKYFSIPTVANMTADYKKQQNVLEVIAPDRPGLLAQIGQVFVEHKIQLQNARITTLGERVEDVFFITDESGHMIEDEQRCASILDSIRQRLDRQIAAEDAIQ